MVTRLRRSLIWLAVGIVLALVFGAYLRPDMHGGLRHVVAAHLSRENNRPELALAALAAAW